MKIFLNDCAFNTRHSCIVIGDEICNILNWAGLSPTLNAKRLVIVILLLFMSHWDTRFSFSGRKLDHELHKNSSLVSSVVIIIIVVHFCLLQCHSKWLFWHMHFMLMSKLISQERVNFVLCLGLTRIRMLAAYVLCCSFICFVSHKRDFTVLVLERNVISRDFVTVGVG